MSDCQTAFKEWCDKWDVETNEEHQNFWMDGFNDAAGAWIATIRAQTEHIARLTAERDEARKALRHCIDQFVDADNLTTQTYLAWYESALAAPPPRKRPTMSDYEGCSDGNCKIRLTPLKQHTNGGCRCLRDIPAPLRIAINRKLVDQAEQIARLTDELATVTAECNRLRAKPNIRKLAKEWASNTTPAEKEDGNETDTKPR